MLIRPNSSSALANNGKLNLPPYMYMDMRVAFIIIMIYYYYYYYYI